MIEAVKTRLVAMLPELSGRIRGATELAEAMQRSTLPGGDFFAYVTPTGLQGGQASAATGVFRQALTVRLTVTLGFRTRSATAEAALTEIDDDLRAVLAALCGWTPDEATPGVFTFLDGSVVGFEKGAVLYELNFQIDETLRIT